MGVMSTSCTSLIFGVMSLSKNNECLQQNNFICTQLNPTLIYMIQKH